MRAKVVAGAGQGRSALADDMQDALLQELLLLLGTSWQVEIPLRELRARIRTYPLLNSGNLLIKLQLLIRPLLKRHGVLLQADGFPCVRLQKLAEFFHSTKGSWTHANN